MRVGSIDSYSLAVAAALLFMAACGSSAHREARENAPVNKVHCRVVVTQPGNSIRVHLDTKEDAYIQDIVGMMLSNVSAMVATFRDSSGTNVGQYREAAAFRMAPAAEPGYARGNVTVDAQLPFSDTSTAVFRGTVRVVLFDRNDQPLFDSIVPAVFNPALRPSLAMRLYVEPAREGIHKLSMILRRLRAVEGEYCPSTLTHDYCITAMNGKVLWQMSYENMYGQMLTSVLPKDIGQEHIYNDDWDGNGNLVPGHLPAGRYRLIGIVPSKPVPVRDSTEFTIE
jgi:hypothetical protein